MRYVLKNKRAKIIILSSIVSMLVLNHAAHADILYSSVEFTVPYNNTIGSSEPFTPLVNFNGTNYLVWVDANLRPWVSQKSGGSVLETVPLDPSADYTTYPDGHHRYSMGIDTDGYLHIAGDMHYYPSLPANYLPARYQNQTVMYWVSNQPYDITSGFTFAGGAGASTAIPGQYFNTGYFFNDKYGELYFTAMIRAYQSLTVREQGEMGVGLYTYNVTNKTWSIIGDYGDGVYPAADNVQEWKTFFWENAGVGTPGWSQDYQSSFVFDNNNHLHFAVAATVNTAFQGNTRLLYAVSKDSGATWCRANGSAISALPLRGVDTSSSCADVVVDTKGVSLLGVSSWVVADAQGRPFANGVSASVGAIPVWYRWNGTAWTGDSSNLHKLFGAPGFLGPDGKLTFVQENGIWLRRTQDFTQFSSAYSVQGYLPDLGLSNLQCMSGIGLQTTGSLYGIGVNIGAGMMNVVNLYFASNSLPWGWAFQDIGAGITLGGSADYTSGTFTVRASGGGVGSTSDTLGLTYYKLTGDGTLIARVASRDSNSSGLVDGIMMRESFSAYSKCVMVGASDIYQGSFKYRTDTGGKSVVKTASNLPFAPWFKIVRFGNVFTTFYSVDGSLWTQFDLPQTIVMASSIYVGLVSNGSPANSVHMTNFDKVEIL